MKSVFSLILFLPALTFLAVHAEEIFFLHCQYDLQGDVGSDIESADFNNDGIIDFITTSDSTWAGGGCGWYEVFLGNGNGTFTRMGSQYVGESQEHWEWNLLTGDFNEDLNEDFLVMNNEESILYNGNGDGAFTETSTFPWKVHNGCAVDFNCDGHLDVSGASSSRLPSFPDSVSVLLGDGTGNFSLSWYTTSYKPFSCQSADFNKDNYPDLIVPCYTYFAVYFGVGDGSFGEPDFYDTAFESGSCYSTCADFDEDGFTDIAVTGDAGMSIPSTFVYLNQQDETFIKTDELFIGECATDIDASDIDLDTHLDLGVSGWLGGRITPGYGDGTFSHDYEDYLHYDNGSRFILRDLVNDNDVDIVTINILHNDCKIFLNTANPLSCEEEVFQPVSVPVIATWPNPFSNNVTIQLEDIINTYGLLHICDISGRLIRELPCAGEGIIIWNGRDADGCELPSGLYVIRYNFGASTASSRILKL